MVKKLRVGVYGTWRGCVLARLFSEHSDVEIVAGCDQDERHLMNLFASRFGQAHICEDYDELLAQEFDILILATYCPDHGPQAVRALEAGKHVLSEVQAFHTPAEGVALVEAVERTGRRYMLAENFGYMRDCLEIGRLYREGTLGEFVYGEADYAHSVRNDDLRGGALAGEYLAGLEHTRIAYVAGPERAMASELRLEGCRQALQAAGRAIPQDRVFAGTGQPEAGERAVRALLAASPRPTALFCYNDATAMGALRAAKEAGLRVPRDLSILGYDDIAAAPYLDPPLTTVAQDKYVLGQRATQMALALIQGRQDVQDVLLQPQLIVRSSCSPPGQVSRRASAGPPSPRPGRSSRRS